MKIDSCPDFWHTVTHEIRIQGHFGTRSLRFTGQDAASLWEELLRCLEKWQAEELWQTREVGRYVAILSLSCTWADMLLELSKFKFRAPSLSLALQALTSANAVVITKPDDSAGAPYFCSAYPLAVPTPQAFVVGDYRVRFLQQPFEESPALEQPRWPIPIFDDLLADRRDEIRSIVPLADAPIGSWLLARLWHLSAGPCGLYLVDGIFTQDGGCWNASWVVQDASGLPLATGFVEAWTDFEQMQLQDCEERFDFAPWQQTFIDFLLSEPDQVACCRVEVRDFERPDYRAEFGWDGSRFLGIALPY